MMDGLQGCTLNLRRVQCLVRHLIAGKEHTRAMEHISSVDYIQSRYLTGGGQELLRECADLIAASQDDDLRARAGEMRIFLERHDSVLRAESARDPSIAAQLAFQEAETAVVRRSLVEAELAKAPGDRWLESEMDMLEMAGAA
mmetsp:Transcript_39216/g.92640  ORF Transcript_39216/g.92640 Transcript_39216/m.92640 type:complete len:143 (+) Transcript_39216:55-483(+)